MRVNGEVIIPENVEFSPEANAYFEELRESFLKGELGFQKVNTLLRGRVSMSKNISEITELSDEEEFAFLKKCGINVKDE
ncbi:TPA: hypothetical protein IEE15_000333 [Campylobacter jejuni]|nr:hypothetical protein [Campylobacter jejuni]EBI2445676.1 hypothetical protein [Campylobacter jejuni]ECO3073542.1 hypothetical protein [Campylobacter jejuni]MBX2747334.1 hypothetical protein [Campylobacter jejuni]HAN0725133.1 hypothetical protein [Campylobacter jejuni]